MEKEKIAFRAGANCLRDLLGNYGLAELLFICDAKAVPLDWKELKTEIDYSITQGKHDTQSFFKGMNSEMDK